MNIKKHKFVAPGKNPKLVTQHYNEDEKKIIDELSKFFYITNGGENIKIGNSEYRYCLIKFPSEVVELFGIELEIMCLFSPFDVFEARTLDAIELIEEKVSGFRLDKICAFVISKCESFLSELNFVIKSTKESKVIIPFTYQELLSSFQIIFINERIRDYFFQRDLFDFQAPLTKDLYFFGRDQVVHGLIDKYMQGEASGIFGLRKSGKTSILHAIHRTLKQKKLPSVIIDCQSLYQGRWFDALFLVVNAINNDLKTKLVLNKSNYSENDASLSFENDIKSIFNKLNKKILIIFDEVEHLSYGSSANEYWRCGKDYLFFWNTIRALFQKPDRYFTFLISGTNPNCIELSKIDKTDNPLFQQFKPVYLKGFSVEHTKQMISTLSKYMHVKFEDEVYTYLTDDFGGHPFLIRQACSYLLNKISKHTRNNIRTIDKHFYKQEISEFQSDNYCQMIIDVLQDSYPDEYEMLEYLSREDIESFNELAEADQNYIYHLLGYSIIAKSGDNYYFNIPVVKNYLMRKNKYMKLALTYEEKCQEISIRRNKLEHSLRMLIRKTIIEEYGRKKAHSKVSEILNVKDSTLNYDELFDPKKNQSLYFSSLIVLITDNELWNDCFKGIFKKQQEIKDKLSILNNTNIGRADAHAVDISDADMKIARGCFESIENIISSHNN